MRHEISRVKEMKQRVKNNYDKNINVTKEVFTTLRKAIDAQEEQILMDIKLESSKREKYLQVSLLYNYSYSYSYRVEVTIWFSEIGSHD